MSILRAGYLVLAQRLQEAAESLSSNELRSKLQDGVSKAHEGTTSYGNYIDHTGDEDDGDCIYQCSGNGESNTMKAPYSKGTDSSDTDYTVDTSKAVKVAPRMTYEEQPDEGGAYAAMEAARLYTKGAIPLCERFVSKKERDAAGSGDFAGKGKSFPILKKEDVAAAAASIGRAGSDNHSTNTIKANIIKIAKAKGWESELPKAWQGDSLQEASTSSDESAPSTADGLKLVETTMRASDAVLELIESAAGAEMEIKLIAPGKGSAAYYTPEALKQAATDGIFDNAQIYINHATKTEQSARPEGNWHDLAGGIVGKPYYLESHKQGPGLYGKAIFTPQYAPEIRAKAAISGMSIRANGDAVMESSGRPQLREGLPVLKKFTSAESVDIVTKAGAGGMILTESARGARGDSMEPNEKRLLESLVKKELRRDAITEGARILSGVSINEAQREYIMDTVLAKDLPMSELGCLDAIKFRESVSAELTRFGAAMGTSRLVVGMGAGAPVELTEADRQRVTDQQKAEEVSVRESWAGLLGGNADAKVLDRAVKGRVN